MSRYLISFDDGAMDHIPAEDMVSVGEAAHAVVREVLVKPASPSKLRRRAVHTSPMECCLCRLLRSRILRW